ncbi:MAG: hypothetical protein Homavirus2_23 [Homavirus sp.]|uniref:Uncharacterized protein n=1 Tax=Homavirus sp. TaxID=2487769 RepID=A0A3G5A9J1_9VIRU|nr:MAG: hypothetical protein Homavirus2_23 [Homavirus sp.]
MEFNFDNKKYLITVVVIIAVILFLWMIYQMMSSSNKYVHSEVEKFNPEQEHLMTPEEAVHPMATGEGEQENVQGMVHGDTPYVDPRTGSLMDGPGFEKCDVDGNSEVTATSIPANYYFLDDGAGGEMSIQNNLCSPSCCSEQWPTPFKQKYDPYVCNNKDQFVPSNMMCNNSFQSSGCLCLTKKQGSFIYNRGINSGGREWF